MKEKATKQVIFNGPFSIHVYTLWSQIVVLNSLLAEGIGIVTVKVRSLDRVNLIRCERNRGAKFL